MSPLFSLYFYSIRYFKDQLITTFFRIIAPAFFLLIGFQSASALFLPSDTTKTDTVKTVTRDSAAVAKEDTLITIKKDSLVTVSKDTLKKATRDTDYHRIFPIPLIGSIDRKLSPLSLITDSIVAYMDYKDLGDLLAMQDGVFVRSLGSPGQMSALNLNGMENREISYLADGIPLREPLTGNFDMNLYPLENAERVELISDTRAFLYDINSTGGVINFVSKSKRAIHPYSRIHYTESGYGYSLFDGMFSQDIYRGLNMTAGVEHATTGGRFENSNFDLWNVRFKMRYNLSNRFNIFASTIYNQNRVGLNGGVTDTIPYEYRFDNIRAVLYNTTAYEKTSRYDNQLGLAMKLTSDSNLVSTLTFYHSTNMREYRDPGQLGDTLPFLGDHRSQWFGANLTHSLFFGPQQFDIGAEVERQGVIASPATGQWFDTRTALYGKSETNLFGHINFAGYARIDQYESKSRLAYGMDAGLSPITEINFFAGFSHSYRFPTIQERFWNDSLLTTTGFTAPVEQHDLFETGMRLRNNDIISGEIKLFHRDIHDAIIIETDTTAKPVYRYAINPNRTVLGISGNATLRIGKFYGEGTAQYIHMSDSTAVFVPRFSASGGFYYWSELFEGHLNLKTGVRGRFIPSFTAPGYDQDVQLFTSARATNTQLVGVMDVVFMAKLGDANIFLIWDNFFGRSYYVTSFYPMTDRVIRFGLSWEFTN